MRDTPQCRWQQWRVKLVDRPADVRHPRFVRPLPAELADADIDGERREHGGPVGIRHELVARIRREIDNGTYHTEEKWLIAEERLLDRMAGTA